MAKEQEILDELEKLRRRTEELERELFLLKMIRYGPYEPYIPYVPYMPPSTWPLRREPMPPARTDRNTGTPLPVDDEPWC